MTAEIISRAEALARGLKYYFTGKPCCRSHISERQTAKGICLECNLENGREFYARNKEKVIARTRIWAKNNLDKRAASERASRARNREKYSQKERERRKKNLDAARARDKAYRDKNPEKHRSNVRAYRIKNPDKIRAYKQIYREKNADKVRASKRSYRERNLEKARASERAWRNKNPDKVKIQKRTWLEKYPLQVRARNIARKALKRAAGGSHTAQDILDILNLQRGKCAYCRARFGKEVKYSVDHIIALARGGSNDKKNIQLLCQPCNGKKWAHDPIDFARSLGKLL